MKTLNDGGRGGEGRCGLVTLWRSFRNTLGVHSGIEAATSGKQLVVDMKNIDALSIYSKITLSLDVSILNEWIYPSHIS